MDTDSEGGTPVLGWPCFGAVSGERSFAIEKPGFEQPYMRLFAPIGGGVASLRLIGSLVGQCSLLKGTINPRRRESRNRAKSERRIRRKRGG